jgi:hypothetical protein
MSSSEDGEGDMGNIVIIIFGLIVIFVIFAVVMFTRGILSSP